MSKEALGELDRLLANGTPTPWEYRPYEQDDWGFIRGPEVQWSIGPVKPVVAIAREGGALSDADEHRRNKTDPSGPNALLIVAAVNALPQLLARLRALSHPDSPATGDLLQRLQTMAYDPHKPSPTHFVNPDGPEAARVIAELVAALEEIETFAVRGHSGRTGFRHTERTRKELESDMLSISAIACLALSHNKEQADAR